MKMLTVFIPEEYFDALDMMVIDEQFPNRSEAIRAAIRDLVQREYLLKETIQKKKMNTKSKQKKNTTQINLT